MPGFLRRFSFADSVLLRSPTQAPLYNTHSGGRHNTVEGRVSGVFRLKPILTWTTLKRCKKKSCSQREDAPTFIANVPDVLRLVLVQSRIQIGEPKTPAKQLDVIGFSREKRPAGLDV